MLEFLLQILTINGILTLIITKFLSSVVSGSSPVIAHMMATGGLHGR
jgi:hypothetical protein